MIQEKQPGLSAERPFVGLRPFGFSDHAYFFGREDQVYSLFRLLDRGRFIAVVGSSGSGKSSLVRAGLLPILEQESAGHGGRQWRWIEMRPGDAPLDNLAREVAKLAQEQGPDADAMTDVREGRIASALRRSSFGLGKALSEIKALEGQTVLLVVDQFEELFRFAQARADVLDNARWREEAAHFVQTLLEATRERTVTIHVLITMRSDFIGDCAQFYGLPEAVSATQFLVPSTTRDQREQIITDPVAKAGAAIDPLLVEQLLNDVSDELDQLPVLQHCLMRLWEAARADANGERPLLTAAQYDRIGRAQGALSQHAEEIFAGLEGRALAVEQMFRAIAEIDNDGRAIRRALPFHGLLAETGIEEKDLREVCDRFRADDCSFLVPPGSLVPRLEDNMPVDVGHEALLRRWPRIGARASAALDGAQEDGWLVEEDRDGRKYRALLALVEGRRGQGRVTLPVAQVEEWMEWWNERPRTEAWADRYGGNFARIRRLLSDSVAALADENIRIARQKKFDRFFRVAAACALVVIVGLCALAGFNWWQAANARQDLAKTEALSEIESTMMLDQMTSNLYATFENFRLVPHSELPVEGVLEATRRFRRDYVLWARNNNHPMDSSFPRLDAALAIVDADMNLVFGDITRAVNQLDSIEKNTLNAMPADTPAGLLLRAEFYFYRGTAERYGDLFERARYDYTRTAGYAQDVMRKVPKSSTDRSAQVIRREAEALWRRALRVRVEVDTSAHQVSDSKRDQNNAFADNQEFGATFSAKDNASFGGDLSNIGARPEEKIIHDAMVDLERGRFADTAAAYKGYIASMTARKSPDNDLLSAVVLAGSRQNYARALSEIGQLDEAEKQIDLADDYYEQKLKPGDEHNPFALHSDDQVHWVRGIIAAKRGNMGKARNEFNSMLHNANYLIGLDLDNAREWDDAYKAHVGLAKVAELSHDANAQKAALDAAAFAKNKADDVRRRSIAARPAAEREAINRQ